jgi:hypothetical protein
MTHIDRLLRDFGAMQHSSVQLASDFSIRERIAKCLPCCIVTVSDRIFSLPWAVAHALDEPVNFDPAV